MPTSKVLKGKPLLWRKEFGYLDIKKKRKRKKERKYTHTDNSITKVNFQRNERCKSMRKKMSFGTEKRTSGIIWIFTFQDLIFFGK